MNLTELQTAEAADKIKKSRINPVTFTENLLDPNSHSIIPPEDYKAVYVRTLEGGKKEATFILLTNHHGILQAVTVIVSKDDLGTMFNRIGAMTLPGRALDNIPNFIVTDIGSNTEPTVTPTL